MFVATISLVLVRKAAVQMVIEDNKVVPLPYPLGVMTSVPRIANVDRKFRSCHLAHLTQGRLVPSLQFTVVLRLVEQLETDNVGATGELRS